MRTIARSSWPWLAGILIAGGARRHRVRRKHRPPRAEAASPTLDQSNVAKLLSAVSKPVAVTQFVGTVSTAPTRTSPSSTTSAGP